MPPSPMEATMRDLRRFLWWKFDHFVSWLYTYRLYGPRCPDYADSCPGCIAWVNHDELFNAAALEASDEQ